MASTDLELARIAFFSIERAEQQRILANKNASGSPAQPEDLINAGLLFVTRAWTLLGSMGKGRDPKASARAQAEEAIIKYTKLRLLGRDPDTDPSFMTSVRLWTRQAAMEDS